MALVNDKPLQRTVTIRIRHEFIILVFAGFKVTPCSI